MRFSYRRISKNKSKAKIVKITKDGKDILLLRQAVIPDLTQDEILELSLRNTPPSKLLKLKNKYMNW